MAMSVSDRMWGGWVAEAGRKMKEGNGSKNESGENDRSLTAIVIHRPLWHTLTTFPPVVLFTIHQACIAMSSVVRPRSVANPSVGIEVYIEDLRTFKGERTWPQIVGKSLVKDHRQVLPRDVVILQPLFLELMSHGLTNCMVTPSRLEQACRTVTDPTVPEPYNAESYALALADHIRPISTRLLM